MQDLGCLKRWMEEDNSSLVQLHDCKGGCLDCSGCVCSCETRIADSTCSAAHQQQGVGLYIAVGAKLASLSLRSVLAASQQADVVSTLPDLEQLQWHSMNCGGC